MTQIMKPPMLAVIREAECIGCTKCIQACPVDAIIGTNKYIHTVMADICTGCELCLEPCPVDCIDLIPAKPKSAEAEKIFHEQSLIRNQKKQIRQKQIHEQQKQQHELNKLCAEDSEQTVAARQAEIKAAVARFQKKRQNKL